MAVPTTPPAHAPSTMARVAGARAARDGKLGGDAERAERLATRPPLLASLLRALRARALDRLARLLERVLAADGGTSSISSGPARGGRRRRSHPGAPTKRRRGAAARGRWRGARARGARARTSSSGQRERESTNRERATARSGVRRRRRRATCVIYPEDTATNSCDIMQLAPLDANCI